MESTHSTPRSKPWVRSGLILHFDKLRVLSLSMEAAPFTQIQRSGFGTVERIDNSVQFHRQKGSKVIRR